MGLVGSQLFGSRGWLAAVWGWGEAVFRRASAAGNGGVGSQGTGCVSGVERISDQRRVGVARTQDGGTDVALLGASAARHPRDTVCKQQDHAAVRAPVVPWDGCIL